MPDIVPKRVTADIEGDFVIFLIGMRINKPWKVHKVASRLPRHASNDRRARAKA
jgi:hypothetical protein